MLFVTVLVIILLAGAEVDLFIPSFPDLIRQYNLSPALVQLTVSVNFLSYCITSLFVGSMGDRFGRRPVIIYSLLIFILGSIFCAFAPSFPLLVAGRFFQGIGMAGPAVLGYVVIADTVPAEKQPGLLGGLNGMVTLAMAVAPIIGSYINIAFGWRGNFIALLILSIIALLMAVLFVPNTVKPNPNISLSLKGYLPLLQSWKYMRIFLIICLPATSYWVFIAMGPIVYMEGLDVPIEHFGYYQGAIAGTFSIVSILSLFILGRYSHAACLNIGLWLMFAGATVVLIVGVFIPDHPCLITAAMCLYALPIVFPMNILYPKSLDTVPNSKARAAAMINFGRLAFSAIGVELVSFFYTGYFMPVSILIFLCAFGAILLRKNNLLSTSS